MFTGFTGNPDADKILPELRRRPQGMTKTEIQSMIFKRLATAQEISDALRVLLANNLAHFKPETTKNGRSIERWFASSQDAAVSGAGTFNPNN